MSFHQVIVKEAKYLSLKNEMLFAKVDEERQLKIPIEDIAIIVIENNRSVVSIDLVNKCMENNISIILCNEKKLPSSIIMTFSGHYRQLENMYLQLELKTVIKQNLWRDIIKNKIHNQKEVIRLVKNNNSKIEEFKSYINDVKRNDISNREALAAKMFFKELYGDEFKRFIDDKINATLNYGYSILVSTVVRQIVSFGLDSKIGIWHSSKGNNLNLAYDLVEPFRPLVDYYIKVKEEFISENLSPKVRRDLVALLNCNVLVNGEVYRLQNAIELYVKSFLNIVRGEKKELITIEIIKVNFYEI